MNINVNANDITKQLAQKAGEDAYTIALLQVSLDEAKKIYAESVDKLNAEITQLKQELSDYKLKEQEKQGIVEQLVQKDLLQLEKEEKE